MIRNVGPSVARNVHVTFDPPLPAIPSDQADRSITAMLSARYARPIPAFMPGVELDTYTWTDVSASRGST